MGGTNDFFTNSFPAFLSDPGTLAGVSGLGIGLQTGSNYAQARYNAKAMEGAADAAEEQGKIQAFLIQKKYEAEYRDLSAGQERQAAENQVIALKRGITGGSADNAMQAYVAKDQRNKERLYYNAAMETGSNSIQTSGVAQAYRAKAAQYKAQGTAALVGGAISAVAQGVRLADRYMTGSESPVAEAERETLGAIESGGQRDYMRQGEISLWGGGINPYTYPQLSVGNRK